MIDWQQVRQLQQDVGKEEMEEVVELFLCEADEAIDVLKKNYAAMTLEDKCASFHFLKGCASNLGFKAFGGQCSLGEETTKNGDEPGFEVSELVANYESSKQQFTQNYETELG